MTELPDPLVPTDIDVDRLAGFLLDVDRLLSSELMALSTGEEFKAAVTLWARAWKQHPAGSLPDDDRLLAAFSGAGPRWNKVKAMALRGFVKCSDGRLYHRVLCEDVLRAADAKRRRRERTVAASEARKGQAGAKRDDKRNDDRNDNRDGDRNDHKPPDRNDNVTRSHRLDGTGQKERERTETRAGRASLPEGWEAWWEIYPHKVGKDAAQPAYRKALAKTDAATLLAGLNAYIASKPPDRPWCNPATWLNQGRWADRPAAQATLPINGSPPPNPRPWEGYAPNIKPAPGGVTGGSREDIEMQVHMGVMTQAEGDEALAKLERPRHDP